MLGQEQNTGRTEPGLLGVTLPNFSKDSGGEQRLWWPLENPKWNRTVEVSVRQNLPHHGVFSNPW